MKDRLPGDGRNFHDARIAEEFGEVATHRACFRSIGRAGVDQQHADLWRGYDPAKTSETFTIDPSEKAKPFFQVAITNRDAW